MDQLKKEIIKHNPKMKSKIQLIGDKNTDFKEERKTQRKTDRKDGREKRKIRE